MSIPETTEKNAGLKLFKKPNRSLMGDLAIWSDERSNNTAFSIASLVDLTSSSVSIAFTCCKTKSFTWLYKGINRVSVS